MRCHKCQAQIDGSDWRGYCPQCFTSIRRGGFFARMWTVLVDWISDRFGVHGSEWSDDAEADVRRVLHDAGIGRSRVSVRALRSQKIVIDDVRSGRKMEFDRWEDVPAEYRKMMASAAGSLRDPGPAAEGATPAVPPSSAGAAQESALDGPPDEVIDLLAGAEGEQATPVEIQRETVQRQEFHRTDMHKLPAAIRALMNEFDIDIPPELRDTKRGRTQADISMEVRTKSEGGRTVQRYDFRGSDGQERIYGSLQEMPANVRQMFERLNSLPQKGD